MCYSVARTCEYVTRQTLDYDSFAQGRCVVKTNDTKNVLGAIAGSSSGRASAIAHRIIQVDARSRCVSVKIGAIAQGLAPSCFNLGAIAPSYRARSRQD